MDGPPGGDRPPSLSAHGAPCPAGRPDGGGGPLVVRLRLARRPPGAPLSGWERRCIGRLRAVAGVELVGAGAGRAPAALGGAGGTRRPDVVLDLTGMPPPADLLVAAPRCGVWAFVYGAEPRYGDLGVREFLVDARAVVARLVRLIGPDQAVVLEEGAFKAVRHSLPATRRRILDAVAAWPARHARRELTGARAEASGCAAPRVRIAPAAGWLAGRVVRAALPAARVRNLVRRIAREAVEERWTVGIIPRPIQHVVAAGFDPKTVRWLPELPDGYLADPCGRLREDGRLTILAEAYRFAERIGFIVAMDEQGGGAFSAPRTILRLPVHASYPQLIAHGGRLYCLPEAGEAGRVQLFRADPFPDRWTPDRILLDGFAGADPTVFRHGGRWWMLAGHHADQDETKLFAFHAPDLFGPWSPHPLNPVKCDLRSARPAGPPFTHEGRLYRPAQDCSMTYGGAVALNMVTRLTLDDFAEETVAVLRPDPDGPYPDGLHTLVGVGDRLTLVDGKRHVLSASRLVASIRSLWFEAARRGGTLR